MATSARPLRCAVLGAGMAGILAAIKLREAGVGPDDIDEAAAVIEPGSSAGILVYENLWAAPFAAALRRGGAQLVASGRIPVQAILAALDASEATTSA